jgi:hypothetical protein
MLTAKSRVAPPGPPAPSVEHLAPAWRLFGARLALIRLARSRGAVERAEGSNGVTTDISTVHRDSSVRQSRAATSHMPWSSRSFLPAASVAIRAGPWFPVCRAPRAPRAPRETLVHSHELRSSA